MKIDKAYKVFFIIAIITGVAGFFFFRELEKDKTVAVECKVLEKYLTSGVSIQNFTLILERISDGKKFSIKVDSLDFYNSEIGKNKILDCELSTMGEYSYPLWHRPLGVFLIFLWYGLIASGVWAALDKTYS